jgi:hypothetical protein
MTNSEQYVPGVCNIGSKEVAKRRALGWIGLAASILLWATFIVLKTAAPWRLTLIVPVMLAALGFLQAKWRFCAMYGLSGAFKFGPKSGRPDTPIPGESRDKDRRTSLLIIGLSALIGLAVAVSAYYI